MSAEYTHSPSPEEIMEYLDGEGTSAARAAIRTHLAGCEPCQAIVAGQQDVSQHLQAWTVAHPPATLQPPEKRKTQILPAIWHWRPTRVAMVTFSAAAVVLVVMSQNVGMMKRRVPAPAAQEASRPNQGRAASIRERVAGRVADTKPIDQPAAAARAATLTESVLPENAPRTPSVIRTATLQIVVKDFSAVRSTVETVVSGAGGFADRMTITGDTATARQLRATLRVPGDRLTATLDRIRQIGQVVEDTQNSQDVTDQIVDLDARLASARATEQRLTDLLRNRTGKLSDVLDVERELARVRLDIERLDAEKSNIGRRVTYATIDLSISEERKAGLEPGPLPLATQIRIATADGLASAIETVASAILLALRIGPTALLWLLAAAAAWSIARRVSRRSA